MAAPDSAGFRGWLRGAAFHYGRLVVLGNGYTTVTAVQRALDARPDESVLDLGCGAGWYCLAAPGSYLGIDLDADYVQFARWRWRSPRRRFEVRRLEDLDGRERFDRAIMASVLHHLSDAQAADVLGQLVRLVRRRLVVLDLDPEASTGIQAWLLRHDRGEFIRPRAQQRALLERHFAVTTDSRVFNLTRTAVHTLFTCDVRA
jgi:2-polyprenyl-3-methyl-5-hydroxy-6-metoxy-1,4-benzoquinol methylase